MTANSNQSDLAFLDKCRTMFQNSEQNTEIKTNLESVGYDSDKMSQGNDLFVSTLDKYDYQQKAKSNRKIAYDNYADKEAELKSLYSKHRKRAKIQFEDDRSILIKLDLINPLPTKNTEWIATVKVFYTEALNDQSIQEGLSMLKITVESLNSTQQLIDLVEESYAEYKDLVGIAEEATRGKAEAFKELEKWRNKFKKVAEIALEDQPQLLESLGFYVKS